MPTSHFQKNMLCAVLCLLIITNLVNSSSEHVANLLNDIMMMIPDESAEIVVEEGIGVNGTHITTSDKLNEIKQLLNNNTIYNHLIIFIHGYNNNDNIVNDRIISIDNTLGTHKVLSIAFNWKSAAKVWEYGTDQECAINSAPFFTRWLQKVRTIIDKIDIIAHSMGNSVLIKSMQIAKDQNQLSVFKGSHIVCVAADVYYNDYESALNDVKNVISNWTHYYNKWDIALMISLFKNGFQLRAGSWPISNNSFVDSIELIGSYNYITSYDIGHGYIDNVLIIEDIKHAIVDNMEPNNQNRKVIQNGEERHWNIKYEL